MSATFGAWLGEQEQRADIVGELARKWAELKGTDKVRALPTIQKRLTEAGYFAQNSPWVGAWNQILEEWRNRDKQPGQPDGEPGRAMAEARAALSAPLPPATPLGQVAAQLGRIEAKLDWLGSLFSQAAGGEIPMPPWPGQDELPPAGETYDDPGSLDWPGIYALADFDALDEEAA